MDLDFWDCFGRVKLVLQQIYWTDFRKKKTSYSQINIVYQNALNF